LIEKPVLISGNKPGNETISVSQLAMALIKATDSYQPYLLMYRIVFASNL